MEDWVGPTAALHAFIERKNSFLCREYNPGYLAHSPSLYWLSYPGSQKDKEIIGHPENEVGVLRIYYREEYAHGRNGMLASNIKE
jgi:hypothetical protein